MCLIKIITWIKKKDYLKDFLKHADTTEENPTARYQFYANDR